MHGGRFRQSMFNEKPLGQDNFKETKVLQHHIIFKLTMNASSSLILFLFLACCCVQGLRVQPGEYVVTYAESNSPQEGSFLAFKGNHSTGRDFAGNFLPKALLGGTGVIVAKGLHYYAAVVSQGGGVPFYKVMLTPFVKNPLLVGSVVAALAVAAVIYVPLYAMRISDTLMHTPSYR